MDKAILLGRLPSPFIFASVRLVGILPVSLFLISLYLFVHGFGFWSGFFSVVFFPFGTFFLICVNAEILRKAKKEQLKQRLQYGELYKRNYYKEVKEKNRIHYELYSLDGTQEVPEDYKEISLVCVRKDGMYLGTDALSNMCSSIAKHVEGLEHFHFHLLRHTFTSNLLASGAPPKDVQELLGHSAVSTTMNIYAHATREAKRNSVRLLDKVAGND